MSRRRQRGRNHDRDIALAELAESTPDIDLHGMTRAEAQRELDLFLDEEVVEGARVIRIIHGHGTGVLREFVAEYLRTDGRVNTFAPATRGRQVGAVTYASLKTS